MSAALLQILRELENLLARPCSTELEQVSCWELRNRQCYCIVLSSGSAAWWDADPWGIVDLLDSRSKAWLMITIVFPSEEPN